MNLFRGKAEALLRRRSSSEAGQSPPVRWEAFTIPEEAGQPDDFLSGPDSAEVLSDRLERESRRRARALE